MTSIWILRLCVLAILVVSVSTSPVYEYQFLNLTSAIQGSGSLTATAAGSFTVSGTQSPTSRKTAFKPYIESTADGFDIPTTAYVDEISSTTTSPLIWSERIRVESSVDGFGEPASTTTTSDSSASESGLYRPHLENSVPGPLGSSPTRNVQPRITAPPTVVVKSSTLIPVVVTSVVIHSITLGPSGATAIIGEGPSATKVHIDPSGHPVVVVGSSTSTVLIPATIGGQIVVPGGSPITVGSGFQMSTITINKAGETIAVVEGRTSTLQFATTQGFTIDTNIPATAIATNYEYIFGSSTLRIGHPITIEGTPVTLTTDNSGSTILINGEATTTLPDLAPAKPTYPSGYILSTIIISGTTQYIIASQTVYPGHPITVDGTVISMTTSAGATMLIVGDKTTTMNGKTSATPTLTPGGIVGQEGIAAATGTTSDAGIALWKQRNQVAVVVCGLLGLGLGLG